MVPFIALVLSVVVATPTLLFAFPHSPHRASRSIGRILRHDQHDGRLMIQNGGNRQRSSSASCNSSNNSSSNDDGDGNGVLFDPFLQSPLSFGKQALSENFYADADDDVDDDGNSVGGFFGFRSTYAESNVVEIDNPPSSVFISSSSTIFERTTTASLERDTFEFDPLLSPHAYANGIAAGPVRSSSATTPLLHTLNTQLKQQQTIGILLIDHGSKRSASNEHIHTVARMYEDRLNTATLKTSIASTTIVRAAHMEIANPSILDSLRNLFVVDQVAKVVCVPYFLSPGRHATEDVPNLINEARKMLIGITACVCQPYIRIFSHTLRNCLFAIVFR
jgi:sirohydrochlorin ferrochelatase